MRLSTLLGKTLRHPPSDAHLASHQLLIRGAFVRDLESGRFAFLPLGCRTLERLRSLAHSELGAQQLRLPALAESPLGRSSEASWEVISRELDSYRQLPVILVDASFKHPEAGKARARAESSSRAGLFLAGERPLLEITALGPAGLADAREQVCAALARILAACDLPVVWAAAGREDPWVYVPHPHGDDEVVRCPGCGYAEVRSHATPSWPDPPPEAEQPIEEIATPGCDTIAALAEFLDIPAAQTLKMVFYSVEGQVTCAVLRGDRRLDEAKLARILGTEWYYPSLEEELAAIGAVGGYASPIGLDPRRVRVVADGSVLSGVNFVSGANRPGYHLRNVNVPRDFVPGEWADLAEVEAGDPCPACGSPLQIETCFALVCNVSPGPRQPTIEYLDAEGQGQPLWSATWKLDLGRLMAAIVEEHRDDYGILWPAACAPFDLHLVALDLRREEVAAQADALYERLQAGGLSVLYDDRDASAGVKFNDADLIGIPLRLTVSHRSVQGGRIEAKWRNSRDRLSLDEVGLAAELARLRNR